MIIQVMYHSEEDCWQILYEGSVIFLPRIGEVISVLGRSDIPMGTTLKVVDVRHIYSLHPGGDDLVVIYVERDKGDVET